MTERESERERARERERKRKEKRERENEGDAGRQFTQCCYLYFILNSEPQKLPGPERKRELELQKDNQVQI